jgi:hypothetical protein
LGFFGSQKKDDDEREKSCIQGEVARTPKLQVATE